MYVCMYKVCKGHLLPNPSPPVPNPSPLTVVQLNSCSERFSHRSRTRGLSVASSSTQRGAGCDPNLGRKCCANNSRTQCHSPRSAPP